MSAGHGGRLLAGFVALHVLCCGLLLLLAGEWSAVCSAEPAGC